MVKQPKLEKQRGDQVEESTHTETLSMGKFQEKWAKGSHASIPPGRRWGDVEYQCQEGWNRSRIIEVPNLFD